VNLGQGNRKHPALEVGDRFGALVVIELLPRGHRGRSDERVRWRCVCGVVGESYAANLRRKHTAGRACVGHRSSAGGRPFVRADQ
jgi:hypothetical protein